MITLETLGRLTLARDGAPLLRDRRKDLALLAYLSLLPPGRSIDRGYLASLLWPTSDSARARQSLRRALVDLRQALGDAVILDDDRVTLAPGAVDVDAARFQRDVAENRWRDAADRWSGDFLIGLEDLGSDEWRSWLEGQRTALRSKLAFALEQTIRDCQARGQRKECIKWAERWVDALPADERGATQLILALRGDDRAGDAAARHAVLVRQLEELNGAKPSPAFLRLGEGAVNTSGPRPGVRGLLNPELVGREKIMTALTGAWAECRRGAGRVVILEAEDGLGKTRVGEEIVRYVRASEGRKVVIEARAFAAESDRAFFLLRLLLAQLAAFPSLASAAPGAIGGLSALSPAIRERFPHVREEPVHELDDALLEAVGAVAEDAPVFMLLDDAPAADQGSQGVLAALVRRTPRHVLVVMTGDPAAWAGSPLIAQTGAPGHVDRQTLSPLSPDDTQRLLASVAPMDPGTAQALAKRLHAHTAGSPGLILSQLRQLADEELLRLDAQGRWSPNVPVDHLPLTMPSGLREVVMRRLQQLPEPVRRLVEVGSVIGPRIHPAVLERVAGLAPASFREALTQAMSRRLLRQSSGPEGELEFQSDAERRTTYELVVPSARQRYHRAAAAALSREGDPSLVEEVRRHRQLGGHAHSWRRVVAASATVLALAASVGWWIWTRSGGAVTAGAQVLLASVEDLSADSTLSAPLTEAARIGLQQSKRIHLYSRTQIRDALRRMQRADSLGMVDEGLAREIAVRDNLPAVIHLAVGRVDSSYLLTGRVIDPATGQDLAVTKEAAESRGRILYAMDRVLGRLRRELGESRSDIYAGSRPLPLVTTASLPALEEYTTGRLAWTVRQYSEAHDHWIRAVALDSGFALALSSLGGYYFLNGERATANRFFDRALAHVERLTPREALALRSNIAGMRGPLDEAIRLAQEQTIRYPERDTWYALGTLLMQQSRLDEAQPALARALALDSNFTNGWINLATVEQLRKQLPQALAAYAHAARLDSLVLFDATLNLNQEWGATLLAVGEAAAAESVYRRMAAFPEIGRRAKGLRSLAWLLSYQGKFREAARYANEAAQLNDRDSSYLAAFRNRAIRASLLASLGDKEAAASELHRAEQRPPLASIPPIFLFYAADAWTAAGDTTRAARLLPLIRKNANPSLPEDHGSVDMLRALMHLRDGRIDSSMAVARAVDAAVLSGFRDEVLAVAFERAGHLDSALAAASRLARKWQFGWEAQHHWVRAPLRVARLSLALGDTVAARNALDGLLKQWRDADQDLPDLKVARRLREMIGAK